MTAAGTPILEVARIAAQDVAQAGAVPRVAAAAAAVVVEGVGAVAVVAGVVVEVKP